MGKNSNSDPTNGAMVRGGDGSKAVLAGLDKALAERLAT